MNSAVLQLTLLTCLGALVGCGKVNDSTSQAPGDADAIDTGGEKPNPDPVALSADPPDLTTALPTDIVPAITVSGRGTPAGFVPNYLRDAIRAKIQVVTYPEGDGVSFTTEVTSDPTDKSLAVIAVHTTGLEQRWYALKLPAIDGTKVPLAEQPEGRNQLEVRFHPGSDARVRLVQVCAVGATSRISLYFSEAVSLTGDINTAFSFSQAGSAISCKNIRVPVPGVSEDFTFDCSADRTKPVSVLVGDGLKADADGPVPSSSTSVNFANLQATSSGCGLLFPTF